MATSTLNKMEIDNFRSGLYNRRVLVGTTAILRQKGLEGVRSAYHFNPNGRQEEFRGQTRMLSPGAKISVLTASPGGSDLRGAGSYATVIAKQIT